ncbi:hypothetical protein HBI31_114200 [Parastagonospora nodorum]|nr:hypothetical protein HBI31_114200 [Parastagonospora nodorum]
MSGRPIHPIHRGRPPWPIWNQTLENAQGYQVYHCAYMRHVCSKRNPKVCPYPFDEHLPFCNEDLELCPVRCPQCENYKRQHDHYPVGVTGEHWQQLLWHDDQVCDACKAEDDKEKEGNKKEDDEKKDRRRKHDLGRWARNNAKRRENKIEKSRLNKDQIADYFRERGERGQPGGGSQGATQHGGQMQTKFLSGEKNKNGLTSDFRTKQKETKPPSHSSPKPINIHRNMALKPHQIPETKSAPRATIAKETKPPKRFMSPPKATQKPPVRSSPKPTTIPRNMALRPRQIPQQKSDPKSCFLRGTKRPKISGSPAKITRKPLFSGQTARFGEKSRKMQSSESAKKTGISPAQKSNGLSILPKKKTSQP